LELKKLLLSQKYHTFMDSKTRQNWETFDDPLDNHKLEDKKWPQTNQNTSMNNADNLFSSVSNSTSMSSGVDSLDFGHQSKIFVPFDDRESVGSTSNYSSENSVKIQFDIPPDENNDDKYAIFSQVDKVDGGDKGWGRSVLGVGPLGWSNDVLGINDEEKDINLEKTRQKSQQALKIGDDSVKAWFNNLK